MIKRTVYVVGAGASYEVDLPTGKELKGKIAQLLNIRDNYGDASSGDADIKQALYLHSASDITLGAYNKYISECQHISANMPLAISIDTFIDTEKENEQLALCGKLAIIKSILDAERRSKLNFTKGDGQPRLNFSQLENSWYLPFFRTLTEHSNVQNIGERLKKITLVIFNYDRCIEHFLHFALMSYYRISSMKAAEIISNLTIIHPYGVVGYLDWQNDNVESKIKFGGELQYSQLIKYATGIRTFTEGAHSGYMKQLKLNMKSAERLVFLGFAFHKLNMELIAEEGIDGGYENEHDIDCYATAYETSKSDQDFIKNSILHLYKNKQKVAVYLENLTCQKIFLDYSRSLGYS
jgi:hypothetical protein